MNSLPVWRRASSTMASMTWGQLCLGRREGEGTAWQAPQYCWTRAMIFSALSCSGGRPDPTPVPQLAPEAQETGVAERKLRRSPKQRWAVILMAPPVSLMDSARFCRNERRKSNRVWVPFLSRGAWAQVPILQEKPKAHRHQPGQTKRHKHGEEVKRVKKKGTQITANEKTADEGVEAEGAQEGKE